MAQANPDPTDDSLEIGDEVTYRAGGGRRTVEITGFGQKDGRAVFDGTILKTTERRGCEAGDTVWGYISEAQR